MQYRIPSPLQSLCSLASLALVFLLIGPFSATAQQWRRPIITSIAPDQEDCSNPSSPGGTEDVQITGICFTIADMSTPVAGDSCGITQAYLATTADGSGTRIDLSNIRPVANNEISATVPVTQLASNVSYYVFVVRCDGKVSTSYPNALGYNVTFACRPTASQSVPPSITSCRLVRISGGRYVLQVNVQSVRADSSTVLKLNGTPCPKQKFPAKFVGENGFTTRIHCSGGVKKLLPATLTITTDGVTSPGFPCNF